VKGGHATLAATDDLEAEVIAVVRRSCACVGRAAAVGQRPAAAARGAGQVQGRAPAAAGHRPRPSSPRAGRQRRAGRADAGPVLRLLGSFAGNVALTLGARGGLFIGGGVVPRFADRFFASAFRERFEAKGRFRDYLAAVPTALITDTQAALGGAARAIDGG
jgi:glucokinase